ncbi:pfkB-like carbohydrate kinase family protein [Abeliophyllum distichum]|uniref:PfkB-like carbohydrate kinase family protein n=1 Tax=Abeliophyllum distichum TaxID=126358 RepID=A0ABD1RWN5_9LAMI
MGSVLDGYRNALKETQKAFAEYRQSALLPEEPANELTREDFKGSKWLVIRYGVQILEVIHAAIIIAKQEGVSVSLDLASFEMVQKFRSPFLQLLESGSIDLCFANDDEATEL